MGCILCNLHSHESPEDCKRNISGCNSRDLIQKCNQIPDDGQENTRRDTEIFFHIKRGVWGGKGRAVHGKGREGGKLGSRLGELGFFGQIL